MCLTWASLLSISITAFSAAVFWIKAQAIPTFSWAMAAASCSICSSCCGSCCWFVWKIKFTMKYNVKHQFVVRSLMLSKYEAVLVRHGSLNYPVSIHFFFFWNGMYVNPVSTVILVNLLWLHTDGSTQDQLLVLFHWFTLSWFLLYSFSIYIAVSIVDNRIIMSMILKNCW